MIFLILRKNRELCFGVVVPGFLLGKGQYIGFMRGGGGENQKIEFFIKEKRKIR